MTPAETMPLALELSAYGLATVFASLLAFAALVKALVRLLSADSSSHGQR
jgi:hypothetical protein